MGRWLAILLQIFGWLLGGLLVLIFVAFVGLTATSSGTRWLLGQAEQHVSGLEIGQAQGNLWRGLILYQLTFKDSSGLAVSMRKAHVQLDWRQFWHFSLQIKTLSADQLTVQLPRPAKPVTPAPAPLNLADLPLSLPIPIDVRNLTVSQFTLLPFTPKDSMPKDSKADGIKPVPLFSFQRLQASVQANHQHIALKIKQFSAALPQAAEATETTTIDEQGELTVAVASPHRVSGVLSGLVSLPQGWLSHRVTLGGSLAGIQVDLAARWDGFTLPAASLRAHALVTMQRVQFDTLHIDGLEGALCGKGAVNYADGLQLALNGRALGINPAAINPAAAGRLGFDYQLTFDKPATDKNLAAATRMAFRIRQLSGKVANVPFQKLAVDGGLQGQQFNATISEGTLAGGALRAKGQLGLSEPRPVSLNLSLDHAALANLLANLPADLLARENEANQPAQGKISTRLTLDGTLGTKPVQDAKLNFSWVVPATVIELTTGPKQGVSKIPLALALQGGLASQRLTIKHATVDLADARLNASGDLALGKPVATHQQSALSVAVDARIPNLAHLPWHLLKLPVLAGAIDLSARLNGSLEKPQGTVNLKASKLAIEQWHLAGLTLDGRLNNQKTAGFALRLQADRLTQDLEPVKRNQGVKTKTSSSTEKLLLSTLRIETQGQWPSLLERTGARSSKDTQNLTLSAQGPSGQLKLALAGALAQDKQTHKPVWLGRLTRLDLAPAALNGHALPAWRLQKSASLLLSAQEQKLGETCLTPYGSALKPGSSSGKISSVSHLCLAGDHSSQGKINRQAVTVNANLPLSLLKEWLPATGVYSGAQLPGRVLLQTQGKGQSGQMNGSLKLTLPDNVFRLPGLLADQAYHYKNTELTANLTAGKVALSLKADVPQLLAIHGGGTVGLTGQQALAIKLNAQLPDVAVLQNLLPQAANLKGGVNAALAVGGTLKNPKPSGHLTVDQLAFALPDTGVAYDKGTFDARIDAAGQLVFSGGLTGVTSKAAAKTTPPPTSNATATTADNQRIIIKGRGDLAHLPAWQVHATVQGQSVPVLRIPSLLIDASPNMTVDASQAGAKIKGSVTLPTVTARVEKLPQGAVQSSSDLVIVGKKKTQPVATYPVTGDITIKLGQAVSLAGMGFSTRLAGQLDLRLRPQKPVAALGEIDLVDGKYTAYGQDLSISSGRLLFVGPMDDPGLAVTAQRVIDTTTYGKATVGLKISGMLYHPVTTVFSSPSMPQSDALSLLLTGHLLNQTGPGGRAMLLNAIAGLGISQGNDIVQDIGHKFGFDSVGLDTTGGLAGAQLSVGKKIGDRLMVRYAIGVLTGVSEIITDYRLNNLFSIEITASPAATGGDLIYRIH